MGAQASLGMTQDRQEKAEEIEKSMIARFSTEYLAEYRAQLTAELNSEVEATDGLLAGSVSQLKSRPVSATQAPPPPLYSGWFTKDRQEKAEEKIYQDSEVCEATEAR